ncbi:MAG: prepilin-type N-terminal cleavage/methylation domain-containing protein [Aureliella sp.]
MNSKSGSRAQRTQAFTLIEVVSTMTIGSLLALLAVSVLHQTFSLSKGAKEAIELSSRLDQALLEFRRDAWLAYQAELDGSRLVFSQPDSKTVTYSIANSSFQRVMQTASGTEEAEISDADVSPQRTVFPITQPKHGSRRVELELDKGYIRLSIFLDPPGASNEDAPTAESNDNRWLLERRVVCEIGKWSAAVQGKEAERDES